MILRALALLAFLIVSAVQPNCCAHASQTAAAAQIHDGHSAAEHDGAGHVPLGDTMHHQSGMAACVMSLGLPALSADELAAPSIAAAPAPPKCAERVDGLSHGPAAPPPKLA